MILIGATCAPYKADDPGSLLSWLANAEKIQASYEVEFFAALEVDARGLEPLKPLTVELEEIGGSYWTFSVDDGATTIDGRNRLARICAGRNLITQKAHDTGASHVLFVDTDVTLPDDAVLRLLEVDWPVAGLNVPTYCLDGPKVDGYDFDVREHMNTAGCLLVAREAFRRLRWRWDLDEGLTDDPCYHADAAALGWPTRVRHDVQAAHYPPQIGPVEHRGHDLKVYR